MPAPVHRPLRRLRTLAIVFVVAAGTRAGYGQVGRAALRDASLAAALDALPVGDIEALVVVNDLRRASAEVSGLLDGMDRSDLLIGARPIDHFKSMFGAANAVNDLGTLLIAIMPPAAGAPEGARPGTVIVVPVTDAEGFLNNFNPASEPGHYDVLGLGRMRARAAGTHVLITPDLPVETLVPRGEGGGAWLALSMGTGVRARLRQGEIAFLVSETRMNAGDVRFPAWIADRLPAPAPLTASLADAGWAVMRGAGATAGITVFDLDPLALIARKTVRVPRAEVGSTPLPGPSLGRLPARPYHFAATVDVRADLLAPVGVFLEELVGASGGDLLGRWRSIGTRLQIAVHPPPAGLEGGMISEGVMVLDTSDPDAARAAFEQAVLGAGEHDSGIVFSGDWREDHEIRGVGRFDAWSVDIREWPAETPPLKPALFSMIFGRSGAAGIVTTAPGALIVTFGRRAAHVRSVIAAANGTAPALEADPVIDVMRQWLPAGRVAEAYIASGDLAAVLARELPLLPGHADWLVPAIEPGQPPVGFGLQRTPEAFHAVTIIPAGVATGAIDHLRKRMQRRTPEEGS